MRLLTKLQMRIAMLFNRGQAATRLDDELRFHLDRQIAENVAAGMSAEEARCAALKSFGNPALLREQARATWSWTWLELLLRDVRYAVRTLLRTPGFAIIAILVMALGIGANIAMFTIVRAVLLEPLPFKDPENLVRLYEQSSDGKFQFNDSTGGVFAEWKQQNKSFSDLALAGYAGYNLSGTGNQLPEGVRAGVFSANFLPLLGVQPALGRSFTEDEDKPSANPTVLLSWGLWKRRFGGNPAILNQTILLNAKPYTVVGVLPAWFAYPNAAVQLWTPIYQNEPNDEITAIDSHDFLAIGRLKPGVTPAQAVADLSVITRRLHNQHLDDPFVSISATSRPLLDSLVGNIETPLYVLLAATGCVLLIACLNVANLLVARAAARKKEHAIRTAMGGGRLRLLRQQLMESLVLSSAGGAVGLLLATGVIRWFVSTRPEMVRVESIHMDAVVAVFAAALIVLCAIFAGLISAFSNKGGQILATLQESSRANSAGQGRTRLRAALLSLEVGLTVMLLIGAGLLMKSYARLRSSDLGCTTHNVLKMDLTLPLARYSQQAQRSNFFDTLLGKVRSSPGVEAAGFIFPVVPGDGYGGDNGFTIVGRPPLPQGKQQYAMHRWADSGYFGAIGIPILRGHTFDDNQKPGHATEAIISQEFARQSFPGEDPIGKQLMTLGEKPFTIVGVVGDTRYEASEPPRPMMYFPRDAMDDMNGAVLVVRSGRDVTQLAMPIQSMVAAMDRDLPVSGVLTMDQVIGKNTMDASFDATLLLVFAALSLLLAAVGLFGVLSYIVAQRTSEIGIRIALGARREQVLRKLLLDGLRPALFGLVLGLAASVGAARLIQSMLYATQPLDPAVFAAVSAMLLLVAALACLVPAWRASRLDPMQALRTE
ncbi:MAG: ABC transporter permease [Terracidiphilus sp.]|jgi:putative ABC transport system permease protein